MQSRQLESWKVLRSPIFSKRARWWFASFTILLFHSICHRIQSMFFFFFFFSSPVGSTFLESVAKSDIPKTATTRPQIIRSNPTFGSHNKNKCHDDKMFSGPKTRECQRVDNCAVILAPRHAFWLMEIWESPRPNLGLPAARTMTSICHVASVATALYVLHRCELAYTVVLLGVRTT